MDAFFSAVEEKKDPSLKGKPFVIGSMGDPSKSVKDVSLHREALSQLSRFGVAIQAAVQIAAR
jgi:hypothetical protein